MGRREDDPRKAAPGLRLSAGLTAPSQYGSRTHYHYQGRAIPTGRD